MSVLYLVIPLAILLSASAIAAFLWAVRGGQFDDVRTPGMRILHDDDPVPPSPPAPPPVVTSPGRCQTESAASARENASMLGRTAKHVNCFNCLNRNRSEWCQLSPPELRDLDGAKICHVYQPGQTIFFQGNQCLGVYCIESGTVALRKTDASGNSVIVRMVNSGETLGYRAYFADSVYSASAEALEQCRICFIRRDVVKQMLENNPALGTAFLRRIARDLEDAETLQLQTATLPVRTRLAHLLLVLKDRFGTVEEDGTLTIDLPLARQDIAAMLGTRPETVARAVRSLHDEGVALFDGRHCRVRDLDELLDVVELAV